MARKFKCIQNDKRKNRIRSWHQHFLVGKVYQEVIASAFRDDPKVLMLLGDDGFFWYVDVEKFEEVKD